jgi:hypothetical protein
MYDSTVAGDIPTGAQYVAGYLDGDFAWSPADWRRFLQAVRVTISTRPSPAQGDVLDIEKGDAQPADAPDWVAARKAAGLYMPTIYGSRDTLALVRARLQRAGQPADYWLADPTGVPHLPAGFAACQWAWPGRGSQGHYDVSSTGAGWPRRVPPAPLSSWVSRVRDRWRLLPPGEHVGRPPGH